MAKYKIPEYFIKGFTVLIETPQNKINQIIKELKKVPIGLAPLQVSDYLTELNLGVWDKIQTKKFTDVLFSLYRLKVKEGTNTEEIARDLYESILYGEEFESKPTDKLESNLIQLLSIHNLESTIKSIELTFEYDKTYFKSRILTDARFSFDSNIGSKIETGVIVHNLKIEYYLNENQESIFIAMDNKDLKDLKEQIIRAEIKEESIKSNLKEKISFIDYSNI